MAVKMFRDCGSEIFNTGTSKCPFVPDYIKAIILTPVGMTFKISDFDTKLGEYAHADRPNRVYPISTIAEYATSGGEAQTSATGYGSSKITGYSELVETYTMNDYDEGLRTNLMKLKNESMRVIFISLAHFKGHEHAGFGGALKNIGMGCGSRAGKMAMHADGKPYVQTDLCVGCGACAKICAHNGPQIADKKCHIDHDACAGCGRCIAICPKDAIRPGLDSSDKILNCKITEYAKAVLDGRPSYCINIVRDISPNCDCHAENDVPIVPDVGMFASADPVALDLACAEAVNRQPVMPNCAITDLQLEHDCDRFHAAHDNTHWQDMIEHGKKLGLGSDEYEIVNIH